MMIDWILKERVENFLLSLTEKQEDYLLEKQALETEKAELILNTNWDELNKERKEKGLPKISNESSRNAYISLQLADNIAKFNEVKLEYDNAKRYYRYLIASMQMGE